MKTQDAIGKLLSEDQPRDAIHVAVAPLVAAERLAPGQHVGLVAEGRAGAGGKLLGIVDPYLPGPVFCGERFFVFLYPNTVTSLRHEWTHPAFTPTPATTSWSDELAKAQSVVQQVADTCGQSYEAMLDIARSYRDDWLMDNSERYEDVEDWPAFWRAVERITGETAADPEHCPFTCSC